LWEKVTDHPLQKSLQIVTSVGLFYLKPWSSIELNEKVIKEHLNGPMPELNENFDCKRIGTYWVHMIGSGVEETWN